MDWSQKIGKVEFSATLDFLLDLYVFFQASRPRDLSIPLLYFIIRFFFDFTRIKPYRALLNAAASLL